MKKYLKSSFIVPIIICGLAAVFFGTYLVLMLLSGIGVCAAPTDNMNFAVTLTNILFASPFAFLVCFFVSKGHMKVYKCENKIYKFLPMVLTIITLAPPCVAFFVILFKSLATAV